MPNIFISYRRADTKHITSRIYDYLCQSWDAKAIFRDDQSLPAGCVFSTEIQEAVNSCRVLIAVMGNQWLTITDEFGQRRLDNPDDWVRCEIASALARGDDVLVIPLLIDGATLPKEEDLPDNLKGLVSREVSELRDKDFEYYMQRVAKAICRTWPIEERLRMARWDEKITPDQERRVLSYPTQFQHDELDKFIDEAPIRARILEETRSAVLREIIGALADYVESVFRVGCVLVTRQGKDIRLLIESDVLVPRMQVQSLLAGWTNDSNGKYMRQYLLDDTYDIGFKDQFIDLATDVISANGFAGKDVDRLPLFYVD